MSNLAETLEQARALNRIGKPTGIPGLLEAIGEGSEKRLSAGLWLTHLQLKTPGRLRFNDLSRLMEFDGIPLPVDEASLFHVFAQQAGHVISEKACHDGLLCHAYSNRFDPIADYLTHLEANDSIKPVSLNTLSTTYLGTTDPLYDAMLRVAVLGAVHRRLNPGCQFDVVVVLKGDQGIRKSTFWKVLASPEWYCSSVPDSDKDLLLNVHSTWIFELAELENVTTKREVGQMKNLITTSSDHIRVPYGKATEEKERSSIFVSSVNGDAFLRDETGHRRFLVIECPQRFAAGELIDVDAVVRDRDRIWKAAVLAYRNGELPMLSREDQLASNAINAGYEIESPFEGLIERWLSNPGTPDRFTSDQALTLSGCRSEGQIKRVDQMEVTNVLTKLGWSKSRSKETINGFRGRFWQKLPDPPQNNPGRAQVGAQVGQHQNPDHDCTLPLTDQPDQPINKEEEEGGKREGSGEVFKVSEKGWSVGRLVTDPDPPVDPSDMHSPF